jgi:hypothetical protein
MYGLRRYVASHDCPSGAIGQLELTGEYPQYTGPDTAEPWRRTLGLLACRG